ncbi:hypothetical protein BDDG_11593, partial [Blastomyces dermatitidis ATCC 18188]
CTIINGTSSSSSHMPLIVSFSVKSSYVDSSVFTDDSKLNVESLIKNLKNVIMKKLSVPCMTRSFMSLPASSAAASQSSTPVSVSDSLTPATPVPATSGFAASAFITSSSHFKKILCRLNKLCLSVCTLPLFLLTSRMIYCIKT